MPGKKRFYILFISREEDGTLNKVPIPLHYAWIFVAAAAIGTFTVTGLAGSYTRMLVKTSHFNQLRSDHDNLRRDYASLAQQAHQKDVQAASLGALATEISSLYGLTAAHLTRAGRHTPDAVVATAKSAPLKEVDTTSLTNADYYKSLDSFYALRTEALSGTLTQTLAGPRDLTRVTNPLLPGDSFDLPASAEAYIPTLWPVTGPITSSFGEREDPILGNGEGEFHPGLDISGPLGTPIHATAAGVVDLAGEINGYGRVVEIDHGHGIRTRYGHMSGFAVTEGQTVSRGDVIGYIGHSGRATGNHVHYEVRINGTPVNPYKYLRTTLADFGATPTPHTGS